MRRFGHQKKLTLKQGIGLSILKINNIMGRKLNLVGNLHNQTKRDCLARMNDDKVNCMIKARKFDFDFWEGLHFRFDLIFCLCTFSKTDLGLA